MHANEKPPFTTAAQVEALAHLADGAVIVPAVDPGKGNRYPWHICKPGALGEAPLQRPPVSRLTAAGFYALDAAGLVGVDSSAGGHVITNRGMSALCSSTEKGAAAWQRRRRAELGRQASEAHGQLWHTVRSMIRTNVQFYGFNPESSARFALLLDMLANDVCNTIAVQTERGKEALGLLDYLDAWVTHTGPLIVRKIIAACGATLDGANQRARAYDEGDITLHSGATTFYIGNDETAADALRALRELKK